MNTKLIKGALPKNLNFHISSRQKDNGVQGVFVCDSTNAGTNRTAEAWAEPPCVWDGTKYIKSKKVQPIMDIPNVPFTGVKLVNFERRDQGGRAYKVTFEYDGKTLLFDFRDDMLLEVIDEAGISKGGLLNGEYVFGVVGSEMKIVLYGGTTYKELLAKDAVKKSPAISKFEIGSIYANTQSNLLYLGKYKIENKNTQVFFEVSSNISESTLKYPREYHIRKYTTPPTSLKKFVGKIDNIDLLTFFTDLKESISKYYEENKAHYEKMDKQHGHGLHWGTRYDYKERIIECEKNYNNHWIHTVVANMS